LITAKRKKSPAFLTSIILGPSFSAFRIPHKMPKGKDFIQIREGPFDLDLIFAPDGIETFTEAYGRAVTIEGLPVCHIDDIIHSKEAAGRVKDKESLPRLKAFRDWLLKK